MTSQVRMAFGIFCIYLGGMAAGALVSAGCVARHDVPAEAPKAFTQVFAQYHAGNHIYGLRHTGTGKCFLYVQGGYVLLETDPKVCDVQGVEK